MDSSRPNEFQLGLVLAGGGTRGAYTAGVLDYLLEVLAQWEKAKRDKSAKLPPWSIRIRNIVSSSAGALSAVLLAASLTGHHEPIPNDFQVGRKPPRNNLLYRAWVSAFTMERLFDCGDLPPLEADINVKTDIKSLLNSSFMMEIAANLCRNQRTDQEVPGWARDIQLYFTFLNMRGVPYSFEMDHSLDKEARTYTMLSHADCMGFTAEQKKKSSLYKLDLREPRSSPRWKKAFKAAAASASIPCVFPSVILSRPLNHYNKDSGEIDEQPSWPEGMPKKYVFNAGDGGTLDNEPVGISRHALERSANKSVLEKSAERSWGAILLVDTESNKNKIKPNEIVEQYTLWENVKSTFLAIRSEAKLKDEELCKAHDEHDFSQYIISPLHAQRKSNQRQLATEVFYTFGGSLHERIRHHDFMLGRQNCQTFLRDHFKISVKEAKKNPIFQDIDQYATDSQESVPIIPIFGTATEKCLTPDWPALSPQEKLTIQSKLKMLFLKRSTAILTSLARNAGILRQPSWWRFWSRVWQKVIIQLISMTALYIFDQVLKVLKDSLDNF